MRLSEGWALVKSLGPIDDLLSLSYGHGKRDLLRADPAVRLWATRQWPHAVGMLSTHARLISAIWLDKVAEKNWHVPWHQDVHIPVLPFTHDAWSNWTQKDGVPMVIPPEPWLSRRLAIRLHLDSCGPDSGPLEIIPGSHRHGRLTPIQIETIVATIPPITIYAKTGDLLVMDPLLLHRSRSAKNPSHRRVIHFEWCDMNLPSNATWFDDHV